MFWVLFTETVTRCEGMTLRVSSMGKNVIKNTKEIKTASSAEISNREGSHTFFVQTESFFP